MDDARSRAARPEVANSDVAGPIGPRVDGPPARRPSRTTLPGRMVTLTPLDPQAHGNALYEGIQGEAGEWLWQYLFEGPFADRAAFDVHLRRIAASEDPLFLAILDNATGSAVGYASYMRIEPVHRVIEVGSILYTPRLQQTTLATEAMYLMARHVFEDLGYRRYEWKCNALNAPSRRAALRFGFTFEGDFPAAHDRQRAKSRHGMVLHAQFGVAGAKGQFRALARSLKFRCGRPAKGGALRAERTFRKPGFAQAVLNVNFS